MKQDGPTRALHATPGSAGLDLLAQSCGAPELLCSATEVVYGI
jgi:hypothetical protein